MKPATPFPRSPCPVANSLEIVGDKWTLLVVRDLLHGKHTYGELADSPEHIPTNILADRLRRLEDAGVVRSTPYQQRPVRHAYMLTLKGKELADVLRAFVRWGKRHIPGTMVLVEVQAQQRTRKATPRSKRPKAGARRAR